MQTEGASLRQLSRWRHRAFAVALLWLGAGVALAVPGATAAPLPSVPAPELEREIQQHLGDVVEFQFIREEAERLGVHAWLFGGTAAGYGHYVKWDWLRRKLDDGRFQKERFDYDYTNIYRSTQDLDIVIDGTPEQAEKLQDALEQRFPHFRGSKSAWEVRLLRKTMGEKDALLNNRDFLDQHTDSNSTGMIEVTRPSKGTGVVRDLRDWDAAREGRTPIFLEDLAEGRLHYYFSERHAQTPRARAGKNPEIFSAVRYLTKAFQYELEIPEESLRNIQAVVQRFAGKSELKDSYAAEWLEKNGKKLVQHAVNIEYAINQLDELGLRQKLIKLRNDGDKEDSLAFWLGREPLRTGPLGTGGGRTARELGLTEVSHETSNYLAYESITRAHTGDPNVLISRDGHSGEAAAYGDGFYTAIGHEGARGTRYTIHFRVRPDAREGEDFVLADGKAEVGSYVVFKNKAALEVVPDTLHLGIVDYFRLLAADPTSFSDNHGTQEKLRRRMKNQAGTVTEQDLAQITEIMSKEIRPDHFNLPLTLEWMNLAGSERHAELFDGLIAQAISPLYEAPGPRAFRQALLNKLLLRSSSSGPAIAERTADYLKAHLGGPFDQGRSEVLAALYVNGYPGAKELIRAYLRVPDPYGERLSAMLDRFWTNAPAEETFWVTEVARVIAERWEKLTPLARVRLGESFRALDYNTNSPVYFQWTKLPVKTRKRLLGLSREVALSPFFEEGEEKAYAKWAKKLARILPQADPIEAFLFMRDDQQSYREPMAKAYSKWMEKLAPRLEPRQIEALAEITDSAVRTDRLTTISRSLLQEWVKAPWASEYPLITLRTAGITEYARKPQEASILDELKPKALRELFDAAEAELVPRRGAKSGEKLDPTIARGILGDAMEVFRRPKLLEQVLKVGEVGNALIYAIARLPEGWFNDPQAFEAWKTIARKQGYGLLVPQTLGSPGFYEFLRKQGMLKDDKFMKAFLSWLEPIYQESLRSSNDHSRLKAFLGTAQGQVVMQDLVTQAIERPRGYPKRLLELGENFAHEYLSGAVFYGGSSELARAMRIDTYDALMRFLYDRPRSVTRKDPRFAHTRSQFIRAAHRVFNWDSPLARPELRALFEKRIAEGKVTDAELKNFLKELGDWHAKDIKKWLGAKGTVEGIKAHARKVARELECGEGFAKLAKR